jgi:hypothetical protein
VLAGEGILYLTAYGRLLHWFISFTGENDSPVAAVDPHSRICRSNSWALSAELAAVRVYEQGRLIRSQTLLIPLPYDVIEASHWPLYDYPIHSQKSGDPFSTKLIGAAPRRRVRRPKHWSGKLGDLYPKPYQSRGQGLRLREGTGCSRATRWSWHVGARGGAAFSNTPLRTEGSFRRSLGPLVQAATINRRTALSYITPF